MPQLVCSFDFVARQKSPRPPTSSWFVARAATSAFAPDAYHRRFGDRLPHPTSSATTSSASPTPPTTWPPSPATSATTAHPSPGTKKTRRHLRARLDALYFHLYGLTREDAAYILSTFLIIQAPGQSPIQPLPHQSPHPRLHERPKRRRHSQPHVNLMSSIESLGSGEKSR